MPLADTLIERLEQCLGAAFTRSTPVHVAQWKSQTRVLRQQVESMEPSLRAQIEADPDPFIDQVCRQFFSALIMPGENVGIIAAMAIGEKQTQLTLNSFHSAGIACLTVVNGVTRFSELMNATSSLRNAYATLHLKNTYTTPRELRDAIGDSLVAVTLAQIVDGAPLHIDPNTHTVKFQLQPGALFEHRIRPDCAAVRLQSSFAAGDISVTYTWDPPREMSLTVSISEPVMRTGRDILQAKKHGADTAILNKLAIQHAVVPALRRALVAGTPGIHRFYINVENESKWTVQTVGTNLGECILETSPLAKVFDTRLAHTNNVGEVYEHLGIEAAREFLIREFAAVVNADGSSVSMRHIQLLVDAMTRTGSLTSVSRYGLRQKASVFARSSFEETVDNLMRAACFAERDNVEAVSASIMTAKRACIGTGHMDVLYDAHTLSQEAPVQSISQAKLFDDKEMLF